MNLSQKVAFNTAVQVISKAITVALGLITTILLTRYLGREGFGDYTFVLTYILLFGAVADWGTALIGVREAAADEEKRKEIFGAVFWLRFWLSLLAMILAIVGIWLIPLQSSNPSLVKQTVLLASLLILFFATKASFGMVFQTTLALQKLAYVDILISLITLGLTYLGIMAGVGLAVLIGVIILANLIGLGLAYWLAKDFVGLSKPPAWSLVSYLGKEALPMGAVLVIFSVYNKIDTVMLASLKGSAAVGIYGVAYRIYDVLVLGAAYFMNAMMPVLSQSADLSRNENRFKRIYQVAFDVLLMMAAVMLVFTLILSPFMVWVIGGKEFAASAAVLQILVFAAVFAYFNHLTGFAIVALKQQRRYVLVTLVALAVNVILNLILIPRFSYFGAAGVTIITEGSVLLMTSFYIYKLTGYLPSLLTFPQTVFEMIKKIGKVF